MDKALIRSNILVAVTVVVLLYTSKRWNLCSCTWNKGAHCTCQHCSIALGFTYMQVNPKSMCTTRTESTLAFMQLTTMCIHCPWAGCPDLTSSWIEMLHLYLP